MAPFSPTSVSDKLLEAERIMKQLVAIVGGSALSNSSSVEALAADWITNMDPMKLSADSENLIQRYLLVFFYIATTQQKSWLSCNAPEMPSGNASCIYAKIDSVDPVLSYKGELSTRWLSKEHECLWAGILCDSLDQTRVIELVGQQIRATFPTELALLPHLNAISLQWNEFYGPLPTALAKMKRLLNIELHYNDFTGTIPQEWYRSSDLQRVNLGANLLTGTVATEIGTLTNLKDYFCFENLLSGTIPSEIGRLPLANTRWQRNHLKGSLPSEIGHFHQLKELWLHANNFTGTLPVELAKLTDLVDLRLHVNGFSGSIPHDMYGNFTKLTRLDMSVNQFEGTLSTQVGLLRRMQSLRIAFNKFSGTIPTEAGLLVDLDYFYVQANQFTGAIPTELCSLRADQNEWGVGINGLVADCHGAVPEINCTQEGCCSECCAGPIEICPSGGPSSLCCLPP